MLALLDLRLAGEAVGDDDRLRVELAHLRAGAPARRSCIETSWWPASKPHEPASPQQPAFSVSTSTPIFFSSSTSGSMPPVALWWQWPQTNALRSSRGGSTSNFSKNSAKWIRALREPLRVVVVRQELPELVLEHGHAARLEPDDRDPLAVPLAQLVEAAPEVALGQVEEAVVVQRPPAADVALGDRSTCQPAASSASTAATPTSVCMWLLNVSGKRTTFRPAGFVVPPRCLNHCWSVSGANVGHRPLLRHPGGELEGLRERRRVRDEVDEPGARDASRATWSISPNA